ncbi:hypothetical protein AB0I10_12515 [Streptomyces sp. NPDC050636]|uniref:hypothetical protein n=1 Tax=Streptomyces sp. NPDC050636 TaxID=3154510 RepID=UPI003430AE21
MNFVAQGVGRGRSMAGTRPRRMARPFAALCGVTTTAALTLAGCSDSSTKDASTGLPEPKPGKLATFSLAGLSSKYDLNYATDPYGSRQLASDQSGNVYLMKQDVGTAMDIILKMTPHGAVSKVARIPSLGIDGSIAVAPDGELLVGGYKGLFRVDRHAKVRPVNAPRFKHPNPIGARPDGSMVVKDEHALWSLKGTHKTRLYTFPKKSGTPAATVDATGTIYTDAGSTLKHMLVLAPGHGPRALSVRGNIPGTKTPISSQTAITMTPARGGGLYAQANTSPTKAAKFAYIVRVRPSGSATVLARGTMDSTNAGCKSGKHYPALNTPCPMPWFVVQSGKRLLVMGSPKDNGGDHLPAFALRAVTK